MASPRWQRGVSGNPAGRLRGSRNALSEAVICALLRDFRQHGQKAIAQVRKLELMDPVRLETMRAPDALELALIPTAFAIIVAVQWVASAGGSTSQVP
jgi:uncharacterized protein DUF5681